MILNNEQIKKEIQISGEKFTITDKRLIFNNGHANSFIGISELRGVDLQPIDVKVSKLNLPENKVLIIPCVLVVFVSIFVYNTVLTGDYFPSIFFALFLTAPIAIGLLILLNIINSATTKLEKRTLMQIKKTDEGLFLNQYYSQEFDEELNDFATAANSIIYR